MPGAPVRSSIAEVVWPAVPERRASAVLAVLFQLEQTQWWSPEALHERQFDQLRLLLAHAQRTIPFYRARLNQAGVEPDGYIRNCAISYYLLYDSCT